MSISVSSFNDILKEAYTRYENRPAEEYRAYMDGITDMLNIIVLTDDYLNAIRSSFSFSENERS